MLRQRKIKNLQSRKKERHINCLFTLTSLGLIHSVNRFFLGFNSFRGRSQWHQKEAFVKKNHIKNWKIYYSNVYINVLSLITIFKCSLKKRLGRTCWKFHNVSELSQLILFLRFNFPFCFDANFLYLFFKLGDVGDFNVLK